MTAWPRPEAPRASRDLAGVVDGDGIEPTALAPDMAVFGRLGVSKYPADPGKARRAPLGACACGRCGHSLCLVRKPYCSNVWSGPDRTMYSPPTWRFQCRHGTR